MVDTPETLLKNAGAIVSAGRLDRTVYDVAR